VVLSTGAGTIAIQLSHREPNRGAGCQPALAVNAVKDSRPGLSGVGCHRRGPAIGAVSQSRGLASVFAVSSYYRGGWTTGRSPLTEEVWFGSEHQAAIALASQSPRQWHPKSEKGRRVSPENPSRRCLAVGELKRVNSRGRESISVLKRRGICREFILAALHSPEILGVQRKARSSSSVRFSRLDEVEKK
jgi:hypothetical protein